MASKLPLLIGYLLLVGAAALLPFVLLALRPVRRGALALGGVCALVGMGAALLTVARGAPEWLAPLLLSPAMLVPLAASPLALLGGAAALPLFAPATWWMKAPALGAVQAAVFVAVGLAAAGIPRLVRAERPIPVALALAGLGALGLLLGALTAPYGTPLGIIAAWHHWGAYVSPAEAVLAGGLPFRDFSVQYGMGPTLLLLALDREGDLWPGMAALAWGGNALYLVVLGGCLLALMPGARRGEQLLALAALAAATLLWTGYPPIWTGPLMTPSVAGLRFLPLALLLLVVLTAERVPSRGLVPLGHAVWFASLGWSPEAGFFATLVWWPWLALRRAEAAAGPRGVAVALLRGAALGLAAVASGMVGLAVLFRWGFGAWPSVSGYLTHILHPPGVMPVNATGPVWLMLAAAALALACMARSDAAGARRLAACLLAVLGAGSYWIGRSHDNNLLNLFPLLVVVLVAVWFAPGEGRRHGFAAGFAKTAMAAMLAWVVTFGAGLWREAIGSGEAWTLGPGRLLERTRLARPEDVALLARYWAVSADVPERGDLAEVLAFVRGQEAPGALVLFGPGGIMLRQPGVVGWTAVNNFANYGALPPEVAERFIRQGAATFGRPGWLLLEEGFAGWLAPFGRAYDVAEEHRFGTYAAYRLVPRR